MPLLQINAATLRRPEIVRFCAEIKDPDGFFYVLRLWLWAAEDLTDPDISVMSPAALSLVAGWRGDCDAFAQALLDSNLIYATSHGVLILCVYGDYAVYTPEDRPDDEVEPKFSVQKKAILAADRERICVYCERLTAAGGGTHIDHVIPRARGGSNRLDNLVVSCRECNTRKGDRTPVEAGMTIKRRRGLSP